MAAQRSHGAEEWLVSRFVLPFWRERDYVHYLLCISSTWMHSIAEIISRGIYLSLRLSSSSSSLNIILVRNLEQKLMGVALLLQFANLASSWLLTGSLVTLVNAVLMSVTFKEPGHASSWICFGSPAKCFAFFGNPSRALEFIWLAPVSSATRCTATHSTQFLAVVREILLIRSTASAESLVWLRAPSVWIWPICTAVGTGCWKEVK